MREGFEQILAAVSRSFYLTIRVLPPLLRQPVSIAYLLARTSDTVADSAGAPVEIRLDALRKMQAAVQGCGALPDFSPFIPSIPDPGEKALLEKAGAIWACLNEADAKDRVDICQVMQEILRGQELDLIRFSGGGSGIRSLQKAAELEDYTYSVAGCVGEFWTRICSRNLRNYAPDIEIEKLCKLGVSFGKGLQLVNILTDAPEDFARGRCYFPAEELGGIDPAALREQPALARPVCERWMKRAREHLEDGFRYIEQIQPWRIRLACFLPWALGVKTLQLMERSLPLETAQQVKVPRKEVRKIFLMGIMGALGNAALRQMAIRVKKSS